MSRPFLIALQFLTRLPVRPDGELREGDIGRSLPCYPLVGLTLGGLLAGTAWLLQDVPIALRCALLLAVWVASTGALHLDGLADSADAWAGGRGDAGRTLALMKDPCSGPMGVAAVALTLLIKFGALNAVCGAGDYAALVLAPLLGRTALPLLFLTTPYVRPGGLGSALARHLPRRAAAIAVVAGALSTLAAGITGAVALLAGIGTFWMARRAMLRRIGGSTGDTAGALVELTEAAVLVGTVIARTGP